MSEIPKRTVHEGDTGISAELCLPCAHQFNYGSSSRGRRDVAVSWLYGYHTCVAQGVAECTTAVALKDEDLIWRVWRPGFPLDEEGGGS